MASDMAGKVKHTEKKVATPGWEWLDHDFPAAHINLLHEKYVALSRLRQDGAELAPQSVLRELAQRFPGVLRQLDQLPLAVLDGRLAALTGARAMGVETVPEWVRPEVAYHHVLRVALRIRMWQAQNPAGDLPEWVSEAMPVAPGEPTRAWCADRLGAILAPPGGRLNGWVLATVASYCGLEAQVLSTALFGKRILAGEREPTGN